MDSYGANALARQLITERPDKIEDILARCCEENNGIRNTIMSYLVQSSRSTQYTPISPPTRFDITFPPPPAAPGSLNDSHHSESPPARQRLARNPSMRERPYTPLSPPRTASSTASHSSRGGRPSRDFVTLLTFADRKVEETLVSIRNEPIKHSVIREDIICNRYLNVTLNPTEVAHVTVPRLGDPDNQTLAPVSYSVELTWCRPRSDATHVTTFYIVNKNMLDVDILLGYEDSGVGRVDCPPTVVPPLQHQRGYVFNGYQQNVPPSAPTPPAQSFHRSTMSYQGPTTAMPPHHQHLQDHIVENLSAHQRAQNSAMEASNHLQHSPANTVLGAHSSRLDQPQPIRPPANPSASLHNTDPNAASKRIRLNIVWDTTSMNVWLDPSAPGEEFYKAFHQMVAGRKSITDRAMLTISLKKDKHMPDGEAYALSLDEDELDADWETTLEWLEENKRDKSPHLFGRVQVGEG